VTKELNVQAQEDLGTYPAPSHGWTCFHCGETFLKAGPARDHFGTTQLSTPACRIKAGDELGLVMALRRAEDDRDLFLRQRDELELQLEAAQGARASVLRMVRGATSAHDVWCHMETVEGRALAAEAILGALERLAPELVLQATVEVCGPGTYYPISSAAPLPRATRPS
jgi:hypothetical protein